MDVTGNAVLRGADVDAYDILKTALPVNVDYGTRTDLSKLIRDEVEREAIRIF